jgi:hypothetical protein
LIADPEVRMIRSPTFGQNLIQPKPNPRENLHHN